MKKILLTVFTLAMIVCLAVGLCACNSATTQGQLENPLGFDHKSEKFVYDAYDTLNDVHGEYTVLIVGHEAGETISDFGDSELANVEKGILVTGELKIGGDVSSTGCYFKLVGSSTTYMVPVASYTVHTQDGKETFRLQATYGSKTYDYTRTIDGTADSGSIKISGTCFDNNEFHQMLRTISTYSSGVSLAYNMPLVTSTEALSVGITATMFATQKVSTSYTDALLNAKGEARYPEGMECYVVNINRSTEVAGASQKLYYAVDNVPNDIDHPNVRFMQHILVKIVEPYKVDGKATFPTTDENGNTVESPIQMEYTLVDAAILCPLPRAAKQNKRPLRQEKTTAKPLRNDS